MRTRLRSKSTLLFVAFAALLLAIGGTAMAITADPSGNTSPAPTIQSDKADYAPGETVTLTGSNWQAGESVNIRVNDDVGNTWSRNVDVNADANGNITDSFNLPDWFVATYTVTASGASGTATTSFTDANLRFLSSGPTLSNVSWQMYSNNTCTTAITGSGSGDINTNDNTGQPTSTLQVAAGNNVFVKLTAPATAGGQVFSNWSATSGGGSFTTSDGGRTICAAGDGSSGLRRFLATYAADTAAPTGASIVIDNGAAWTKSPTGSVSLALSASDNAGVASYRLAQTQAGLASATSVPVSPAEATFGRPSVSFTLTGSEAASKAVWLRVCDAANNCAETSDTIGWDKTAPTVAPGDVNDTTWRNSSLSQNFTSSDSGSGLAANQDLGAGGSFTLTASDESTKDNNGNIVPTTVSKTVSDVAGNSTTRSLSALIDLTRPDTTLDPTGPSGWINSTANKTFSWSGSDNLTANANLKYAYKLDGGSYSAPTSNTSVSLATLLGQNTLSQGEHTFTVKAIDLANNEDDQNPATRTFSFDSVAPQFQCDPIDTLWHGNNVTLNCNASDGGSGLAPDQNLGANGSFTLSTDVPAGTETANASTGNKVLTDAVGNTVTAPSIEGNMVDKKAPSTSADTGTYNGGWTNQNVTVTLNANDGGSGVKKTEYSIDNEPFQAYPNGGIPVTSDGDHTILYRSTDNVDNQEQNKSLTVKIDKTPPEFSCDEPDGNWHADDVTLDCTASDGGSGLADAGDASFSLSTSVAAGEETDNALTGSKVLTDAVGNSATAGPIDGNKVDKKAPQVVPGDVTDTTWRNSPRSEDFTASDGGSGLAANQGLGAGGTFMLTASAESANASMPTVVSKEIEDAVGNTTTRSVSALIDLTPPNISATVVNDPAPSGWYNISTGGPQIDFECTDALSGIASCGPDGTIESVQPNTNATLEGTAVDNASNSASTTAGPFKVDLGAPDVAGAPDLTTDSGDPNDNLTNVKAPIFDINAETGSTVKLYAKKDGVETFIGQDTVPSGGVVTITSNQELAAGQYEVYAHVIDQAGNVSGTNAINITIVTIDATAPDAPGLDMAASSDTGVSDSDDKTNNDKPTFSGSAEAGSTLKLYDGASLLTTIVVGSGGTWSFTPTTALSEGAHQIKATATDAAANLSDESLLSVVIDKTPPVISGADVNNTTWRNTDLSVDFTSSDALSGLKPNQNLGANGSFTLTTSGESSNNPTTPVTASKTVEDVAGNSATRTISALVDKTPPSLGIVDNNNTLSYNVCDTARPVRPTFDPTDTLSGLASSSSTWTPSLQPSGVGSYTYKAQAADNATNQAFYPGPTATEVKTYSVVYDPNYTDTLGAFGGVLQPVNLTGPRSAFKLGSTMPVKFQLRCGTTPITNAVAKLYLAKIDNVGSAVNEPTATNSPDIGNQFRVTDATTGQYQFNLSTKAGSQFMGPTGNTVTLGEGTWYMYISLDDGAKFKAAEFDIKK